jgi:adenine-specific DNA-methyltransferase
MSARQKAKTEVVRESAPGNGTGEIAPARQGPMLDDPEAGLRITFVGKDNARQLARRVRPRVMAAVAKYSVGTNEQQARNVVIEGDNLQALVTLYRERGHVDLIATDPPYGTGRDFRYNDKWEDDPNDPGVGEFVSPDDGARHTKWMRFMWPRLQMMKSMLKPSGVLAICIDHRELFHLGQMLDELFGEKNRLAIINWQKAYAPRSDRAHVSTATEYVLVYAKSQEKARTALLGRTDAMNSRYDNPDGDLRLWRPDNPAGPSPKTHQGMVYAIQSPFTAELHYPAGNSCWRSDKRDMKRWLEEWGSDYVEKDINDLHERAMIIGLPANQLAPQQALVLANPSDEARRRAREKLAQGPWPRLLFLKEGEGRPALKRYLEEVKQGRVSTTYWADEDYETPVELGPVSWAHQESGHNQAGINELDAIVGKGHGFDTVKPLKLMSKIIQLWCPADGLVIDAFAGSGTTAHATMQLNSSASAERRFIMIEQGRPEKGDSYARTLLADRFVTGSWASGNVDPLAGGFRFVALRNKVDADVVLQMERDEMVDTVIASYFDASKKRGSTLIRVDPNGRPYLVAKNGDEEGFFLVWGGPKQNTDFTEAVYEAVAAEARGSGLKAIYHVYARFNLYQTENVRFYQIPDRILADFGLDIRSEPFHESDP